MRSIPELDDAYNVYAVQHIFDAVKKSLERLQVDYIDLLQCESLACNSTQRLRRFIFRSSIRLQHTVRGDGEYWLHIND